MVSVLLIVAIPVLLIFINYVSEQVLMSMANFEKRRSISELKYAMTAKASRLAILNTVFTLFLVHFDGGVSKESWFPILKGEFYTSSVQWYREIGTQMIIFIALNIITFNCGNLSFGFLCSCRRCCDRGCDCKDDRRTKQLSQEDYE